VEERGVEGGYKLPEILTATFLLEITTLVHFFSIIFSMINSKASSALSVIDATRLVFWGSYEMNEGGYWGRQTKRRVQRVEAWGVGRPKKSGKNKLKN